MFETIFLGIKKGYHKIAAKIINRYNSHHNKLPKDVKYFEGSLYDAVYNSALKYPYNVAISYDDIEITYKQLIKRIDKCARALKNLGVCKGDKVTICMPNTPEEVEMFYAINEIGAVANMIHPLSSERDIEYYINKSNSKVMLCIDMDYGKVKNIVDNTSLESVIIVPATKSMRLILRLLYWLKKGRKIKIKEGAGFISWESFIAGGSLINEDPYEIVDSKSPAVILYSGGTTGKSKGVVISNYTFNAQALQSVYVSDVLANPENAFLTFLPNFHAFGIGICTHTPLFNGMRIVLIPQFNAKNIKKYIRKYHFNVLCGVPTFYEYLTKVNFRKNELKGLKLVVSGGDAMSLDLKGRVNETLKKYGCETEVRVGYGLTEVAGVVALSPEGVQKESDVIGLPFPDNNFLIIDPETSKEKGINEDGELIISGPNLMMEYLGEEEETKATIFDYKGDKWVHTGDICFIDSKGLVHYKSRLKRMIITSGYNVYPSHVEETLMEHDVVASCAVIGVPDKNKGEVVKAFVVLKDKSDNILAKMNLQKHLKERLAKYEQPKDIIFIDELPKTLVGKVAYKELEKLAQK